MRTRIIGVAVLAAVVATVLFAVPLGAGAFEYLMQHERVHLVGHARDVALSVAGDVHDGTPIDLEDVEDLVGEEHRVTVYDGNGDRLAGSGPDAPADLVSDALDGDTEVDTVGDRFVAAVPVTYSDEVIGAVAVATPSTILRDVAVIWVGMVGLAIAAVSVAWLVGRRQARRLARPLEDLEENARRLGDGDFTVRTRPGGIPEIDAVGAALDATAARLDHLLAGERAFSADVSHQLRTPLAGLRLRLEAVAERADPDIRRAVAASLVDADRLEAIIDELLTLARAGQAAAAGSVDLDALLGELSPEWGARLALHGRDLEVQVDPGTPRARASTAAVRQVLGVLVDNATTHGRGTVAVVVREASGAVAVDVSDEGPGVQGLEGTVFAQRPDRGDGHGIGLALARRLAEAEQGRLMLSRAVPPVFTLLLPVAAGAHEGDVAVARSTGR